MVGEADQKAYPIPTEYVPYVLSYIMEKFIIIMVVVISVIMSSFNRIFWEVVYFIEHTLEIPIDLALFGTTRLVSDEWYGRCMCTRILKFIDKIQYQKFLTALRNNGGRLPERYINELFEYSKFHNKIVKKAMTCDDYDKMCSRAPNQFGLDKYSSDLGACCLIPNPKHLKITEERLTKWLA